MKSAESSLRDYRSRRVVPRRPRLASSFLLPCARPSNISAILTQQPVATTSDVDDNDDDDDDLARAC